MKTSAIALYNFGGTSLPVSTLIRLSTSSLFLNKGISNSLAFSIIFKASSPLPDATTLGETCVSLS